MPINDQVLKLAFEGKWDVLLPVLRNYPLLINLAGESKGYTPLHQAAWHGADLSVIAELLSIGADRGARTYLKHQTAYDIVAEKHNRPDLEYLLFPQKMTIAQTIRKAIISEQCLFDQYDGNQILADKMVTAVGAEPCPDKTDVLENRLHQLFFALTGQDIYSEELIPFDIKKEFSFKINPEFFRQIFFPLICRTAYTGNSFTGREWSVVSDLFEPAPAQWGMRGDLFLWLEMQQALCQVSIPKDTDDLADIISASFQALTGRSLINRTGDSYFFIERFSRGGMSSGCVSVSYWLNEFIPRLQDRMTWLQAVWSGKTSIQEER